MPVLERPGQPAIHYELDDYTDSWKNAPVILLLHGFARSSEVWHPWVPYLSRFYKVVRPDLRGFGKSSKDFDPAAGMSIEAFIADLDALLDHLGVESVHYCGESLGGTIGMLFAAQRPSRVRTLSLISSPIRINEGFKKQISFGHANWEEALRAIGGRGYADARNSADRFPPGTHPALVEWFATIQGASDVEMMIGIQQKVLGLDVTPSLSQITAPVLAFYSAAGSITTPEQQKALTDNLRQVSLMPVASKYHNLVATQPATCATAVLHFCAQHDGTSCRES